MTHEGKLLHIFLERPNIIKPDVITRANIKDFREMALFQDVVKKLSDEKLQGHLDVIRFNIKDVEFGIRGKTDHLNRFNNFVDQYAELNPRFQNFFDNLIGIREIVLSKRKISIPVRFSYYDNITNFNDYIISYREFRQISAQRQSDL